MKRFLRNPKVSFWSGFVVLPIFLTLLCLGINLFAPSKMQFPKPTIIFQELIKSLSEQNVYSVLGNTFLNVLIALSFSFLTGILLGVIIGCSKKVWGLSQPTVDFFRSVPVTFLIPAVALLIGSLSANIVWILATYPCMLIMIVNVRAGLDRQDKQEKERILSFRIISGSKNSLKTFFKVTLYEILPEILTGLRISLSYCIVIVTVLEYMLLGNKIGIGGLIYNEYSAYNYPRVYALIFLIGLIGFLLNKLVEGSEYFLLRWSKVNDNDNE